MRRANTALYAAIAAYTGAALAAPFPTLDGAATAALEAASRESRLFEYGGAILSCRDGYSFTAPDTSHSRDSFRLHIHVPEGCALAGIYHTHPGLGDAQGVSCEDVQTAIRLGVPSYIAVLADKATIVVAARSTAH